jgi:tRNA pseudouridine38-40 synthase
VSEPDTVGTATAEQASADMGAPVRRARLVVAYSGASFHGFAPAEGLATVLGTLTDAVELVVRQPVSLTGAGRTDAGVHAWGQVVSGDLPADVDLADLVRRLNKLCAPHISVRHAEWAEPDFDARFSATWRRYRYHVWNDPAPNPLLAGVSWHVHQPLDLTLMRAGISPLIGEHDFSSFCRKPRLAKAGTADATGARAEQAAPSMVRIVRDIAWERLDGSPMLRLEITGSAFCHQMVRSITGTLVDVGLHRLSPADVHAILHARDRAFAGQVAPPEGLILWEVGYDGDRWDAQRSHDAT